MRGRIMYNFIHVPKTAGLSMMKIIGENPLYLTYIGHHRAITTHRPNKFSFVRNPYDRLVSAYFYLIAGGTGQEPDLGYQKQLQVYSDFKDFVSHIASDQLLHNIIHLRPMTYYLCDDRNKIVVTRIYKFEEMAVIDLFLKRIGIKSDLSSVRVSPSRHDHYSTYLDADITQEINRLYKADFEIFGYKMIL